MKNSFEEANAGSRPAQYQFALPGTAPPSANQITHHISVGDKLLSRSKSTGAAVARRQIGKRIADLP